ncbi:oligoendopeptidase F [Clostridium perfringens]|uniref:Oligopeptidase F n=1 Tax=Clostridium perfringens E str. JGS1987 TaxID=451755 RepID=B1BTW4_CLOPF|nr:oligoendopeptidase F [Clostridium perfringens]EDT14887.1 oligoendopeptidase F [Clostridium perfringens E str. JGS1987]EJT5921841.1 oligoendopeptidase F [Clostridium perfringens]EJT6558062.1 oligoendopeptidase F [Clostridium perfringens]EJT6613278.1 oligoendopeptidase F [Clostridium perfringens]ELC8458672.1 oligoendopeptidase F [Clostridium perfringens]
MSEVKKLRRRDEIPESDKWRIDKIYETPAKWNEELNKLKEEAPKLKDFEGKLGNKEDLKAFLLLNEKLSRKLGKLYVYAHMRSHEDTSNPEMQSLVNKIDPYSAEFSSYTAYFVPEILSLKEGTIENFINEDKDLKQYKIYFEMILNEKPHILSKEVESVLASVSDCLGAPESIYSMLTNSDMTFGEIVDESGRKVELTEGNYSSFIKSKDRKVREAAFKLLFGTYKKYENTLATSLTSSIKNFVFESKTRKYNSSLEASLKPNNIPVEVYYNALKTVDGNIEALHRYVRIKKKLLNLEEIHMYDLYVPVIECKKEHLEYKDAISLVEEGLKPLGKEYLDIFNEGINEGWIDVYENKGKRSGAYSWGSYDTMPYVLLNYNYELNDASTLAHEMGHSIHSYYTRKTQPYIYGDYSLFCAEVASTTNEILLIHHLIEKETDKNKKLYLINQELEQIRTTVFRQLMFAEFELKTHEAIENGESLTSEVLCKMWKDINIKYFGEDMNVDEEISIEWARIPHFYSDFYVYQYATGYAAASSFANSILSKGEEAVEKYKGFLKAGGSMYPIDTLKMAGVDMTTSKPLKDTLDRFNELLDMLEEII